MSNQMFFAESVGSLSEHELFHESSALLVTEVSPLAIKDRESVSKVMTQIIFILAI